MRPFLLSASLVALALAGLTLTAAPPAAAPADKPAAVPADKVTPESPDHPDSSMQEAEGAARAETAFALDLYARLAAKTPAADNLCLSPYGAQTALGLAAAGARGETAAGAAKALRLTPEKMSPAMAALRQSLEASASRRFPAARLGLRLENAKPTDKDKDKEKTTGVRVADVVAGSLAARAGLQAGDVVTAVDGRPVASAADLANALDAAGEETVLQATREGAEKPLEVKVSLAAGPAEAAEAVQLHIATSLWGQADDGFRPQFLDAARGAFLATVHEADFAGAPAEACKAVNDWAAHETNDKVKDLLSRDALASKPDLILANAVYFKAPWAEPFQPTGTKPRDFFVAPDQAVPVETMDQTGKFPMMKDKGLQMVELPYQGGEFALTLLLPEQKDGLADLEKSLTTENLERWGKQLEKCSVRIQLPRFRASSRLELKDPVSAMGMVEAFSPAADFSGLSPKKGLSLSSAVHQSFISVDESGTEAAAATAVAADRGSAEEVFRANHPFLFLVRDVRTNTILFIGRVASPQSKG